ncbi:crossover junction endodeoxyribonuclease RuvC [Patescibacteria group bacterium]|nr:crossover junction endodeoxyribonuclease RuvC [Patescibacteria group bacterium]
MTRILSIDPGYDRCGAALITVEHGKPQLETSTCITTKKTDTHSFRLAFVFKAIQALIEEWQPTHIAVETLFFSVNKTTALKVAEARGIVVTLAGLHNIPLIELSPQEVKQSMTGSGNANKAQVQKMVALTLVLDTSKLLDDEIDAIAVGFAAAGALKVSTWQ